MATHDHRRRTAGRTLLALVTAGYAVGVGALLLPGHGAHSESPVNLVPFETIGMTLRLHNEWYFQLLLFNALVLVPAGVLLALWSRTLSFAKGVLAIVGVAVGIELAQWVLPTGRSVDIDDVLMNASGGVIAFAATRLLQRWARRFRTASPRASSDAADERRASTTV